MKKSKKSNEKGILLYTDKRGRRYQFLIDKTILEDAKNNIWPKGVFYAYDILSGDSRRLTTVDFIFHFQDGSVLD